MRTRIAIRIVLVGAVAATMYLVSGAAGAQAPLAADSARITISGTSNVHDYTASTTVVRVTQGRLGAPSTEGANVWAEALKPGGVEAFAIVIPAATLSSPKKDIDKNMLKALQVEQHKDITFRLVRLEPAAAVDAFRAIGTLQIAGVEREVALDVTTTRKESSLVVQGRLQLLMTDYGIKPPTAMLGMLKTNPKVTVTFETVLTVPGV